MNEEEDKDPIGKALGLNSINSNDFVDKLLVASHDDSAKADFEKARANIHNAIQNGQDAIDKLYQIADASQHPRAFEVLGKLIDTVVNANKELLELQTKIREIGNIDTPINDKAKTINNNLFVGSTAELQKFIKNMNNGNESQ